jgi:hypothetical protein
MNTMSTGQVECKQVVKSNANGRSSQCNYALAVWSEKSLLRRAPYVGPMFDGVGFGIDE